MITDPRSPIYNSRYRQAISEASIDKAKAEYVAGVGTAAGPIRDITYNAVGLYEMMPEIPIPEVKAAEIMLAILGGGIQAYADEAFSGMAQTFENLSSENARARQSKNVLDYFESSDYKYLVDDEKARRKFIRDLETQIEKLDRTDRVGFLPPTESDIIKQQTINALLRVIFLNENYGLYSKIRDEEIREAMKNY